MIFKLCKFILKFDAKSKKYFNIVAIRYEEILYKSKSDGIKLLNVKSTKYVQIDHLIWMLNEIQSSESMSFSKKHRWLGYVQGIMIANDIMSVDEERNFTRGLFLGD